MSTMIVSVTQREDPTFRIRRFELIERREKMKEIRQVGTLTDFITRPPARKRMTLMVNIVLPCPICPN